jgi:hypothetical protein
VRPAVRRNGARRRASQGTAAKEKHERNVFFFFSLSQSSYPFLSQPPSLDLATSCVRARSRARSALSSPTTTE